MGHGDGRLASEWWLVREDFIQDATEGVGIGASVDGVTACLFGGRYWAVPMTAPACVTGVPPSASVRAMPKSACCTSGRKRS